MMRGSELKYTEPVYVSRLLESSCKLLNNLQCLAAADVVKTAPPANLKLKLMQFVDKSLLVQLGLDVDHCVSYIEPLIIPRYPNCRIAFIFDTSPTLVYYAANKRNTNFGDRRRPS